MEAWAKIIQALGSLLWPLLAIGVLLRFGPAIRAIVETARSRKFTIRIGGQELTMEEASQQQGALIADLQKQLLALRGDVGSGDLGPPGLPPPSLPPAPPSEQGLTPAVLWVDDNPKNNSYFVQMLQDNGISVELALSTEDGLRKFHSRPFRLVVSDMGRAENGKFIEDAGLLLLRSIRAVDKRIPFVVFCSGQKARQYREKALAEGATAITASGTDLAGFLLKETIQAA